MDKTRLERATLGAHCPNGGEMSPSIYHHPNSTTLICMIDFLHTTTLGIYKLECWFASNSDDDAGDIRNESRSNFSGLIDISHIVYDCSWDFFHSFLVPTMGERHAKLRACAVAMAGLPHWDGREGLLINCIVVISCWQRIQSCKDELAVLDAQV